MTSARGVSGYTEAEEQQQHLRFQIELEFVQCLSNPNYLNFLAQRGYFKESTFINYLKYLLYWKEPEYAKYLKYPQCLHFLELLQYEHFRKELMNSQCAKFIDDQQLLHWQHYQRKRMVLLQEQAEKTAGQHPPPALPHPLPPAQAAQLPPPPTQQAIPSTGPPQITNLPSTQGHQQK